MTKYQLATGSTISELEEEVNHFLKDGWTLHGHTISHDNQPTYLIQALTKEMYFIPYSYGEENEDV